MILRRVELKNILSHENTSIELPYGIIAIIGPNGAGKSSIIDAIYIALFAGDKIDIRGGKKEHIIMRGRSSGEISVEFEMGGHQYLVTRKLYRTLSADVHLYRIEGSTKRLIAEKIDGVTATIARLLGFTDVRSTDIKDVVRTTIIALQGELTKIIERRAERKEYILTLLGLNYLEEVLNKIKNITKQVEELNKPYNQLEGSLNTLKNMINEYAQSREMLTRVIPSLESEVKKLEVEISDISKKIQLIDEYIDHAKRLEVAIAYKEMRRLEEELKRLEDAQRVWNSEGREAESLLREVKEFKDRLQKIRQGIERILNTISKEFSINVDSIDKVSSIKNSKKDEMDRLIKELGGLKARKSLYQVYIERFEANKVCPLCGASISNPDELKKHIADEISKIDLETKRINNEISKLSSEISHLESFESQLSKLYGMYQSLTEYIQSREARLAEVSNKVLDVCRNYSSNINDCIELLKELSEQYERLKLQLDHYRQIYGSLAPPTEDVDTIIVRLKDAEKLGVQIPAKLDLGSARQLIESLEAMRNSLDRRLRELNRVYAEKKGELEGKKKQLENVEGKLRELNDKVKQIEEQLKKLAKTIDAYNIIEQFAEKYLGKGGVLAKELTKFVRAELERRTDAILARLGLREITINEDYDIFIKIGDDLMPLSNASGGERIAIAIAMRLALAELVMGRAPTVLILDEPTVYLDDERRVEIFSILGELGRNLKQVIIVTHDEKVIDIADAVIRVENIGNVSRVTRER
jgi:exonuclease SbcC